MLAHFAVVLAILAVCSSYMVWSPQGTLAKYRAAAQGSSTVSVAKWKVDGSSISGLPASGGAFLLYGSGGNYRPTANTKTVTLSLKNESEVTANFKCHLKDVTTNTDKTSSVTWAATTTGYTYNTTNGVTIPAGTTVTVTATFGNTVTSAMTEDTMQFWYEAVQVD
ncbi:MAG: hypothetical protein LBR73_04640 [Oscillospiraceae bacterium]|nr:hypothetical protein [Oscillospiraceae bacterium]